MAEDHDCLTLAELAEVLDPPVTVGQLEKLVAALGILPAGVRRGRGGSLGGRPPRTYRAALIMAVHSANVPFMVTAATSGA